MFEARPSRHTVQVSGHFNDRQRQELPQAPCLRIADLTPDAQFPGFRVDRRDVALMEHRPAGCELLAGREPGGQLRRQLEAGTANGSCALAQLTFSTTKQCDGCSRLPGEYSGWYVALL